MILTITLNAAIDKRMVANNAQAGEVNRISECQYTPGGKGLNVSKVLELSGAQVLASGFVGGFAGRYIVSELQRLGISSNFYYVDGESRSCINIWDEAKREQTEYLEPGFEVSEEDVTGFLSKYENLVKQADVVVISGSIPKGVPTDIYKRMTVIAKEADKQVILDSSGEMLALGLEACPTLIKPNIDEIRMLTGRPCDDRDELMRAAEELHGRGIPYVVISLGSEGAVVVSDEGCWMVVPPEIDAVNTVGCGDAMVAGLALGLAEGAGTDELIRKAAAISTAAAMNDATGFYRVDDMRHIYKNIQIDKMGGV